MDKEAYPTKERVREVLEEVDALDLPDGAHWAMVHEKLGLEYGDVFEIMAEHAEFFGLEKGEDDDGPTYMDGTPVPAAEVEAVAAKIQRGEMKIIFAPEALEDLKAMGVTEDEMEAAFRGSLGVKPQ
jgi:hypothetical protein